MNSNKSLAAIHGYLCSDGYVTAYLNNLKTSNNKYHHIGFRNTNLTLLKDLASSRIEENFTLNIGSTARRD
jgi:hypothetical protein